MTALMIANTQIRRDDAGRYCLNDLHQASGGEARHQPAKWAALKSTQDLIAEVEKGGGNSPDSESYAALEATSGRFGGGTYAVKELVYAYAMWISAAFHLHVIRAYDAMVANAHTAAAATPALLPGTEHRADQVVSAGRIFSSALRVGRGMRMSAQRARAAAAQCALRHTGIDWVQELGAEDALVEEPPARGAAAIAVDSLAHFMVDWKEGTAGAPYGPALINDLYSLYARWCGAHGHSAVSLKVFNAAADRVGLKIDRKRWRDNANVTHGPHSTAIPTGTMPTGHTGDEAYRLGVAIQQFRAACAEDIEA